VRRGAPVSAIRGELLTHINYAFARVTPEGLAALGDPCVDIGECAAGVEDPNPVPGGNFEQLRLLKQRFPHLKVLISFGGWSGSRYFSDAAATPEARRRFVESALDLFIRQHPGVFDGIDIDWEYPVRGGLPENTTRPEDRENYTLLMAEFRRALDEQGARDGRQYLLTIAAAAGQSHIRNLDVPGLAAVLDFINVMTYDFHTAGKSTHFNSPLFVASDDPTPELSIDHTVRAYLAAGLPAEQLVVGVPFFGYGYGGVPADSNGLFQPAELNGFEPRDSTQPRPWGVGAVRFHQVIREAESRGFRRYWHSEVKVPWLYNAETRVWITYDDAESIGLKADYIRDRGLGGAMIWELGGDDAHGTLLRTLRERLAGPPQTAGPRAIRGPMAAGIDSVFADIAPGAPGCALGVVRDGELAYAKGYGTANLDHGLPITPSSVFYMGSVSKQFTAAAVVLAARDGALSLDDDVRRWIPELPDYGRPITIRHLIHHTNGLRDYLALGSLAAKPIENVFGDEATLRLIVAQRALNHEPGAEYLYSNSGYFLLAEIIRRATGKSLRQFTHERIFAPLGMKNTHFHDDRREVVPLRVTGYDVLRNGTVHMNHPWNFERVGSGGLYSSVEDLVAWVRNFQTEQVGGPGFMQQMLQRGILNSGDTIDYAFALRHGVYRGLLNYSHSGSLAGFRTYLLYEPVERTGILVLCNYGQSNPGRRAERVADVVLAHRLAPVQPAAEAPRPADRAAGYAERWSPDPAELDAFTGTFESDELGTTYRIERTAGGLAVRPGDLGAAALEPRERDAFVFSGTQLRFTRDAGGRVTGFTLNAGRIRGIEFTRR